MPSGCWHGKFLRGTAFDPFGYTAESRVERRLIAAVVMDRRRYGNFSPIRQCWKHPLGSQAMRALERTAAAQ
jgi:hypothetical protein